MGNIADGSAVICANIGLPIAARKMTAKSCAVVVAGAAWSIQPGRRRGVGVRRPQRRGLGVHLGHGGAWAAQHLRQGVGGVVTRNQQQAVEQLARGVAAERFDADAVALHFGVGDIGDDGGVQVQLVEGHQRQQHLDGAGGGMDRIRVPSGQNLTAVEVGHDPGLRRSVRDRQRSGRLHVDVGPDRRSADGGDDREQGDYGISAGAH